jgi:folate-binding protein YgfZ
MDLIERSQNSRLWAHLPSFVSVEIKGRDIVDFLQRVSTQKMSDVKDGTQAPGAFLNANGTVVSVFQIFKFLDSVSLVLHSSYLADTLSFLEKYHFGEDISVMKRDVSIRGFLEKSPRFELGETFDLSTKDQISEAEFIALRAWYAIPTQKHELGDGNIILEAPLDEFVHENKGCYPGQEVVERIRTYGNVAKKIVRLNFSSDLDLDCVGQDLIHEGASVGKILSLYRLGDKNFGLGVVKRLSSKPSTKFQVGTGLAEIPVTVAALPF